MESKKLCPCKSTACACQHMCFCNRINCKCPKCESLLKVCRQCKAPFHIIALHERDFERRTLCSCGSQRLELPAKSNSNLQARISERSTEAVSVVRKDRCPNCSVTILIVTKGGVQERSVYECCCPHKDPVASVQGEQTEHETSNYASDCRQVSADRHVRKGLSRKSRTESSSWQAKRAKEKEDSDSDEETSKTEIVDAEAFLAEKPDFNPELDIEEQNDPCEQDFDTRVRNVDPREKEIDPSVQNEQTLVHDINAQSQMGFPITADDTITGNMSLLVNTPGISSPMTPNDLGHPGGFGFFLLNRRIRPKSNPPFPHTPSPIPGPFSGSSGRARFTPFLTSRAKQSFRSEHHAVASGEKIDKWFQTLQSVIITSGELPDAETAAAIDREDKERSEQAQLEEEQAGPSRCPLYYEKSPSQSPSDAGVKKNGKEDGIDPTTGTDRSSTLSKSHKESESD